MTPMITVWMNKDDNNKKQVDDYRRISWLFDLNPGHDLDVRGY